MPEITTATLLALARIDSGTIALPLDEAIYPEVAVQAFASLCGPHCRATVQRADGVLHLELVANDPSAARLQIGNALTELLQYALRERR
jgi:hypothetical protein